MNKSYNTCWNNGAPLRVAIQGERGCFHDAAAHEFFADAGRRLDIIECQTFENLAETMESDSSIVGIMAIENTIAGSLLPNHELIRRGNARIIGEHKMRIAHTLCALPGETIDSIREVNSHPMALMQCEQFLRLHPGMRIVEKNDTAGSARWIVDNRLARHAAICGAYAAELYGLEILARNIETDKHNYTRFLILADPIALTQLCEKTVTADKASLVFSLPHTKGALSKILAILSFYDINLTKIQSTPIIGHEWEYRFYVDIIFESHERYRQALTAIMPLLSGFRELGIYKSADTPAL